MELLIDQTAIAYIVQPTSTIGVILASVFSLQSFRIYRITQSRFLLGLVIGFAGMAIGDFFLLITTTFEPILESTQYNLMYWYRLMFLSSGFAFIALTYHYRSKQDQHIPLLKIGVVTAVTIGIVLFLTSVLIQLPGPTVFNQSNFFFRLFNVIILAYIVKSSFQHIAKKNGPILVPFAFMILLIGQFSVLIFSIDGSDAARIASLILKDVGLFILVWSILVKNTAKLPTTKVRS